MGDSNWSDSFPLDVAGNASRITCKGVDRELDVSGRSLEGRGAELEEGGVNQSLVFS